VLELDIEGMKFDSELEIYQSISAGMRYLPIKGNKLLYDKGQIRQSEEQKGEEEEAESPLI